jgi:hypothetical protein
MRTKQFYMINLEWLFFGCRDEVEITFSAKRKTCKILSCNCFSSLALYIILGRLTNFYLHDIWDLFPLKMDQAMFTYYLYQDYTA